MHFEYVPGLPPTRVDEFRLYVCIALACLSFVYAHNQIKYFRFEPSESKREKE